MGQAVLDLGASIHAVLVFIGDRLGLYKAMAGAGPLSAAELAGKTATDPRYVLEWLSAAAASGHVTYDAPTQKFTLPPEQALALAVEDSPVFLPGAYQILLSCFADMEKFIDAFKTGKGLGWHEHHHMLFHGTERFFRPNYIGNLLTSWIPALDGVQAKLERGAKVADVGCGLGASTILLAKAFPNSEFYGFDYHSGSIDLARQHSIKEGVADRIHFEVAPAKSYPGHKYDLVAFFDCLHDMGDPGGAAKHVYDSLSADGTWMVVEPFAHDRLEDNLTPVGRIFYSASSIICTPASRAQEVGACLGAQAGEKRLTEVISAGGFTRIRRATETPFNMVLEARK
jgi:SAM-dependent methyltransferase